MTKKKGIKLIILVCFILLLCAAYLFLKDYNKKKEAQEAAKEEKITILSMDKESINEISYLYEGETVKFQKTEDNGDSRWTNEKKENLDQNIFDTMLGYAENLEAVRLIAEEQEDLDEYGLSEPSDTITFTTAEGEETVLLVGDQNKSTQDYYLMVKGEGKIYTVSSEFAETFQPLPEEEEDEDS